MRLRKRIYDILDPSHSGDPLSKAVNYFIYSLIFLNVVFIVLESVPAVARVCPGFFFAFEVFTVAVFSVEYLARLWCCVEGPRYRSPLRGRLRYMFSAMALVDLLAILPFYLPFIHGDWVLLRSVRLFRLFRVLKLGRYSKAFQLLGNVVQARRTELLVSIFIVLALTVLSGAGMYYAENECQPEVFSDIPSSVGWSVHVLANMSHPEALTPLGRCLTAGIYLLGLAMFALPTGVLTSGFVEEFSSRRKGHRCPHCGGDIDASARPHAEKESDEAIGVGER